MMIFWTVIGIAVLVVMFAIAIGWKAWKAKGELKGKDRRDAYILTVFLFVAIAAMVGMMLWYEVQVTGQPFDFRGVWFMPIWMVALVPVLFFSNKNKKKPTKQEQKLITAALLIGVIALIAGVLAFMLMRMPV